MSKFQREIRYMVVKLKHLSESQEHALDTILSEHQIDTHTVECVVVEADWPIYEETWENVRRLAEGRASIRDELARAEVERDALAAHVEQIRRSAYYASEPNVKAVLEASPGTSLARLKAQWQAEALEELANLPRKWWPGELMIEANRIRRQAGGDV